MSKFEHGQFFDDYKGEWCFAVSKERFSEEEALKIAKNEMDWTGDMAISHGFVRYRRALTDDGDLYAGWWLELEENYNSCPCWVFTLIEK